VLVWLSMPFPPVIVPLVQARLTVTTPEGSAGMNVLETLTVATDGELTMLQVGVPAAVRLWALWQLSLPFDPSSAYPAGSPVSPIVQLAPAPKPVIVKTALDPLGVALIDSGEGVPLVQLGVTVTAVSVASE
jgi:hypothetical protein